MINFIVGPIGDSPVTSKYAQDKKNHLCTVDCRLPVTSHKITWTNQIHSDKSDWAMTVIKMAECILPLCCNPL